MATKVDDGDLHEALAALRGNFACLAARLKTAGHTVTCPRTNVEIRLHYPAFKNGKPTIFELARGISHFLTYFALHRTECDRVARLYGKINVNDYNLEHSILKQKANDTFKKAHKTTKRNGEAGELLLFLLTEWQLKAPQLLAKLSLKTNPVMPVHGSDGVHVAFDGIRKRLVFYFGEAKVHADLASALNSAAESIAKALEPAENEYELNLVARHIPLSGLSEDAQEAILTYLHPFSTVSNNVETVVTGLVCYNDAGYQKLVKPDGAEREKEFENSCVTELASVAEKVANALEKRGLSNQRVELFLIPMPSVSTFRDHFQDEIGWKA